MLVNSQFGEVDINDDLIETIIKDLPNNYNTLEKCIYIYVRICQKFSFSVSYFLEEMIESHDFCLPDISKDMSSLLFNNITCHKFAILFSTILSNLFNVKTKIVYSDPSRDNGTMTQWHDSVKYGSGHQSVIVSLDDSTIWFDPLLSFLGPLSDLYNVKNGTELKGIKCINGNNAFLNSTIEKVYSNFLNETEIKTQEQFEYPCRFSTLEEALAEFNKSIHNYEYSDIDLLSYMLTCKNRFLINLGHRYEATISIISNLRPTDTAFDIKISRRQYKATWEFILTVYDNENNMHRYFKYDKKNKKLQPTNPEDLKNKINLYTYIIGDNFKIPGINDSPLDFLDTYFKYLSDDEVFMIKDYIEELDSTCQDSLLTYLKHCNHKQIMKLLEDISQVFDYSYPCDINPNFAKNCTNRSICLEKKLR